MRPEVGHGAAAPPATLFPGQAEQVDNGWPENIEKQVTQKCNEHYAMSMYHKKDFLSKGKEAIPMEKSGKKQDAKMEK